MNKSTVFGIIVVVVTFILLYTTILLDHSNTKMIGELTIGIVEESNFYDTEEQLSWIFANCECHQRVKDNPDTNQLCVQPLASWQNETHFIDNNLCKLVEIHSGYDERYLVQESYNYFPMIFVAIGIVIFSLYIWKKRE